MFNKYRYFTSINIKIAVYISTNLFFKDIFMNNTDTNNTYLKFVYIMVFLLELNNSNCS